MEKIWKHITRGWDDVDLSALSRGTYVVALEKEGEVKTKRLIIQ